MIKQEGGKFVVYSESGRRFGSYDTEAAAKRRLAQMEMFKHMKKTAAKSKFKKLEDNKIPLTPEERALVMNRKAVWHYSHLNKPTPAVWKSVDPKSGEVTYVTNTHRAYNTAPTVKGAINKYHTFIKKTAAEVVDLSVRTGPFAPIQKCKVLGAGYKCELSPLYPKPKGINKKAGINYKALMPALSKLHKNTQGVVLDIISRNKRLTSMVNQNPTRAIEEATRILSKEPKNKVKLLYTPQGGKALRGIGRAKYGSVPGLKNFFATEPSCKVLGSGTKCQFGTAPTYTKSKGLGKKAEVEKTAVSPMLVRKTLSKAISSLKTVGLEDYSRVQGKIDKMMGSTLKKSLSTGPKPSKADKTMLNVLKHESNRLGTKYQEAFLKTLKRNQDNLKIGLN